MPRQSRHESVQGSHRIDQIDSNDHQVMTETLILCPGLLCDSELWRAQIAGLADLADITVADFTRDDSIAGMASRLLDQAPDRFALAGLSMGGYVAQEVMRQAPERVTRLGLLDTMARLDTEIARQRRLDLMALAERGKFRGVTPKLLPLFIHSDRLTDEPLTTAVMEMAGRIGADVFLRQQTAVMGRVDGRDDLKRISCPTMVLCGRQDQLTPLEEHLKMAEAIPGADLVVLGHCGHLPTMERPDDTTAAMRAWLTK